MPFTDEQPFLDAVFARYHDDGPRLVYADFLDDAGDPDRAELVRVQIALAHLPDDHPRRPELAERQADLLAAHSARWTAHLGDLVVGVEFRRGVPDSVSVDAATFLARGDELFRRTRVRRVCLRDAAGVVAKLAASPHLARVRELDLCGNDLGNGGLNLLVRSPFLTALDALDLGLNGIDDAGVRALARAGTLAGLTTLCLNDNGGITSDGLAALAASPFHAGLTTLDVSGNDIDAAGVRAVAAGPACARLHTLRLTGNRIGEDGAAVLAGSALFGRMLARSPRLDLRENDIGPAGAAALARSPALARCTALDLGRNDLGDRGFAALVGSPYLGNLRVLKVGRNQITDAGVSGLRADPTGLLDRLRTLDLSGNRLTRYGIGLLQTTRGDRAVSIDLSGNVQAAGGGETPVSVGDVVPGVLREVADAADAAELRRRIAHPLATPTNRPNRG